MTVSPKLPHAISVTLKREGFYQRCTNFFSVVFYYFLHFVCFPTSCSKCCDKHWKTFHLKKLACSVGILLGQVNVRSSQLFTQPVMFDLEIEAAVGGGGRERCIIFAPPPHSSPYFWPLFTPLAQISIFSQPCAAIKIKDGSYSFL